MADTPDYVGEALARHRKAKGNGSKGRSKKDGQADGKQRLVIDPGDLPGVAVRVRDILAASGLLYERGGDPVRIALNDGAPIASPLTAHGVVRLTHDLCRPIKNGEPCTLPERVASLYLDMRGDYRLPKLTGITTAPILREDGSIIHDNGYDAITGMYLHGVPAIEIPEQPTREQAKAALTTLRQTFRTFPFADAVRKFDEALKVEVIDLAEPMGLDESAFLSGLLTSVTRGSLWLAPGLLLNAPQVSGAGTGKGLLARAIAMIAHGVHIRTFTAGNDRHEMDKRLVAEIIEGRPVMAMDNVNATLLKSDTLASLLTERPSSVRPLGKSCMIRVEHASFIIVTGNGLAISEDLARRFQNSELDAHCEDPEQRKFTGSFLDDIKARRAELLGAALTMWRWGRQHADAADAGIPLGGYEQWCSWVRDPLLALGCQDPVARIGQIKERDPQRQTIIEIYNTWWEAHRSDPVRVSELAQEVKDAADPTARGRQYLARVIQNLVGTRLGSFVLQRPPTLSNRRKEGARYRLVQVTSSRDWQKASASSATSGASEKSAEDSNGCQKADQADAPADAHADDLPAFPTSAHHPAGIPGIRNGQNYKNNNGLADLGADNADDADDSRPSRVCPNGYHAASATPEGRVCTVEILEINLVDSTRPVLGPPGDSLEDLRA